MPLTLESLEKVWLNENKEDIKELVAISEWIVNSNMTVANIQHMLENALRGKGDIVALIVAVETTALYMGYAIARNEELERLAALNTQPVCPACNGTKVYTDPYGIVSDDVCPICEGLD